MKNILTLTLLFIITISESFSQDLPAREILTASGFVIHNNEAETKATVVGNTYLNENKFTKAILTTKNGKTVQLLNTNFDVKTNKFIVKIANDTILGVDDSRVKYIILGTRRFERLNAEYYERMSKGKLNLLRQYYLDIDEGTKDPISKIKVTKDKYVIKNKLFIQDESGLTKIKNTKKTLLNLFKESKKVMKKYMKENSLNYKKSKDLKKILSYYNSL